MQSRLASHTLVAALTTFVIALLAPSSTATVTGASPAAPVTTALSPAAMPVAATPSATPSAAPSAAPTAAPAVAPAPRPSATPSATRAPELSRSADRAPRRRVAQKRTAPTSRTIRISAMATSSDMQAKLDRCTGPVQINWRSHTTEIAQHNHCGGAWFSTVANGTRITVSGGTVGGTYVVNGNRRWVGKTASSSALDGLGDLVLQTCVGDRMVLVGLSRI